MQCECPNDDHEGNSKAISTEAYIYLSEWNNRIYESNGYFIMRKECCVEGIDEIIHEYKGVALTKYLPYFEIIEDMEK